jgi:hypothetical protein
VLQFAVSEEISWMILGHHPSHGQVIVLLHSFWVSFLFFFCEPQTMIPIPWKAACSKWHCQLFDFIFGKQGSHGMHLG